MALRYNSPKRRVCASTQSRCAFCCCSYFFAGEVVNALSRNIPEHRNVLFGNLRAAFCAAPNGRFFRFFRNIFKISGIFSKKVLTFAPEPDILLSEAVPAPIRPFKSVTVGTASDFLFSLEKAVRRFAVACSGNRVIVVKNSKVSCSLMIECPRRSVFVQQGGVDRFGGKFFVIGLDKSVQIGYTNGGTCIRHW